MLRPLVLSCLCLVACGPNTGAFKLLQGADLVPSQQIDADGIFGLVANDDLVVVGTRIGELLVFDGNQRFTAGQDLRAQALSSVALGDTTGFGCLAMRGTTVYAGLGGNKLKVISLADPKNPVITATLVIIPATVVATTNSRFLFVSSRVRTQAIDISVSPPKVVVPELPLTSVLALAASEDHLYSTDFSKDAAINTWALDAQGGATMEQRISLTSRITALTVKGTTLYAANSGVLALYDLSVPDAPRALNTKPGVVNHTQYWNRGEGMQGVAVMGSLEAMGPGPAPIFYDVSKPEPVVATTGIPVTGGDSELQTYAAATRTQFWAAGDFNVFVYGRD